MASKVTAGSKAPAFTLPCDGGGKVSLADFKGQKLVLYFYPKADTSGCTREAMDFSRLKGGLHQGGNRDPWGVGGSGAQAGQVQNQAQPQGGARLR